MPRYPIPVMILARLGVDEKYQKLGLGKEMLKDAFLRTLQASEIAGLKAIIAHAKNLNAISFYKKYGFEQSKFDKKHLMLTIQDIFCSLDVQNKL
jgi:ribosomal protein S18 acetylase RimI-like enzyme